MPPGDVILRRVLLLCRSRLIDIIEVALPIVSPRVQALLLRQIEIALERRTDILSAGQLGVEEHRRVVAARNSLRAEVVSKERVAHCPGGADANSALIPHGRHGRAEVNTHRKGRRGHPGRGALQNSSGSRSCQ